MEKIFEWWVFRLRPWMRWAARVIVYIICVSLLGTIAAGIVPVPDPTLDRDGTFAIIDDDI
jgi:hypothetical protein